MFTCSPEDSVQTALTTMQDAKVRRLAVIDASGALQGILSINDVILQTQNVRGSRDSSQHDAHDLDGDHGCGGRARRFGRATGRHGGTGDGLDPDVSGLCDHQLCRGQGDAKPAGMMPRVVTTLTRLEGTLSQG